ncbi:MAG: hypothetical protein A2015_01650 [Spirochaetes bacterium GWF1_31_7]|nr:MAG: hypothetical protein A2Y30_03015 [Spirochaetes bacterium GWE1_32_154]OHD48304.1 MAG: hypothetical protein A2Y29_05530 [Spirochaetes bacterium GWE2_31_10]OHD49292.1 MAG: hypothetical protein A2015_01650 [Spirochaetes bacterium GWF1_31_7]OHD81143.1 MAG: hypothetical protein A2355_16570 [Spirochaetes bacterium RIFOXYB1_FULL_32_8]HBD92968.1 hypothetical protein [Spirochaetia bacterium]
MNKVATINIPEEILFSLRESETEIAYEMKLYSAMHYYYHKKLSIGQAALLAEMPEETFIHYLSDNKISIFEHYDRDELLKDIANA